MVEAARPLIEFLGMPEQEKQVLKHGPHHGGARAGAGRKPAAPGGVDRAFRLYARHLDLIARWQQQHGCSSASEAVRQMLEASPG